MKVVVVLAALVAVCVAAPSDSESLAVSLKDERLQNPENYTFTFETSNGIQHRETGVFQDGRAHENPGTVVSGSAKWTSPEGEDKSILYTADRYGYHPVL